MDAERGARPASTDPRRSPNDSDGSDDEAEVGKGVSESGRVASEAFRQEEHDDGAGGAEAETDGDEILPPPPQTFPCQHTGCNRRARYGSEPRDCRFCYSHKTADMSDQWTPTCVRPGCKRVPSFSRPGQGPTHCNVHKEARMKDTVNRKCSHDGCKRRATHAQPGRRPQVCGVHKSANMVDTACKRCEEPGCNKWPLYAFPGEKARFCRSHTEDGMKDVRSRRCQEEDCNHQPSYGYEGQKALYCSAHKLDDMIDIVSKRCEYENCKRRALYAFAHQKSPRFCSDHKEDTMIDVMNRRCKVRACKKRPTVSAEDVVGVYCEQHQAAIDAGTLVPLDSDHASRASASSSAGRLAAGGGVRPSRPRRSSRTQSDFTPVPDTVTPVPPSSKQSAVAQQPLAWQPQHNPAAGYLSAPPMMALPGMMPMSAEQQAQYQALFNQHAYEQHQASRYSPLPSEAQPMSIQDQYRQLQMQMHMQAMQRHQLQPQTQQPQTGQPQLFMPSALHSTSTLSSAPQQQGRLSPRRHTFSTLPAAWASHPPYTSTGEVSTAGGPAYALPQTVGQPLAGSGFMGLYSGMPGFRNPSPDVSSAQDSRGKRSFDERADSEGQGSDMRNESPTSMHRRKRHSYPTTGEQELLPMPETTPVLRHDPFLSSGSSAGSGSMDALQLVLPQAPSPVFGATGAHQQQQQIRPTEATAPQQHSTQIQIPPMPAQTYGNLPAMSFMPRHTGGAPRVRRGSFSGSISGHMRSPPRGPLSIAGLPPLPGFGIVATDLTRGAGVSALDSLTSAMEQQQHATDAQTAHPLAAPLQQAPPRVARHSAPSSFGGFATTLPTVPEPSAAAFERHDSGFSSRMASLTTEQPATNTDNTVFAVPAALSGPLRLRLGSSDITDTPSESGQVSPRKLLSIDSSNSVTTEAATPHSVVQQPSPAVGGESLRNLRRLNSDEDPMASYSPAVKADPSMDRRQSFFAFDSTQQQVRPQNAKDTESSGNASASQQSRSESDTAESKGPQQ